VLELPKWHGRAWQPVFDTSKVAPYDALIADEELGEGEVREVGTRVQGTTRDHGS
jgi:isoamylase